MSQKKKEFFDFFLHSGKIPESDAGAKFSETFNYWIFRYDTIVYKVFKKPIKQENSAIESHYMNKMQSGTQILSPSINFEIWALEKDKDTFSLVRYEKSEGDVIHFVFKMNYFPPSKLLSTMIEKKKIDSKSVKLVCDGLFDFHKRTNVISDNYTGTYDYLNKIFDDLVFQSKKYLHKTFSQAVINMTDAPVQRYLSEHKRLLFARMKSGKIREIHRCFIPSKIFLYKNEAIFIPMHNDSIAHNYSDVACDVADFSLSLVLAGYDDLAEIFTDYYCQISGDTEIKEVMPFYMVLKAYQRGLYESLKLTTESGNRDHEEKILVRAAGYYDNAAILATQLSNLVTHKVRNRVRSDATE